jgi:hypothetical protein
LILLTHCNICFTINTICLLGHSNLRFLVRRYVSSYAASLALSPFPVDLSGPGPSTTASVFPVATRPSILDILQDTLFVTSFYMSCPTQTSISVLSVFMVLSHITIFFLLIVIKTSFKAWDFRYLSKLSIQQLGNDPEC